MNQSTMNEIEIRKKIKEARQRLLVALKTYELSSSNQELEAARKLAKAVGEFVELADDAAKRIA